MATYLELLRVRAVKKPRPDWRQRWFAAGEACGWRGAMKPEKDTLVMIARKNSPIWKELARGAGGFEDATGEGEPPFAYGSGMGWKKVESKKLKVESSKNRVQRDSASDETTKDSKNTKEVKSQKFKVQGVDEIIKSAVEKILPKKPLEMTIKFGSLPYPATLKP